MDFGSKYVFVASCDSEVTDAGVASLPPALDLAGGAMPTGARPRDPKPWTSFQEQSPPSLVEEPKLLIPADEASGYSTPSSIYQPPLSEKDRELSVKNLVNVTSEVTNIQQLGIQIDLKPEQLQVIKKDHPGHDNAKCEMFNLWLKNDPEASWYKLGKGLQRMSGHFVLSQQIIRDYTNSEVRSKSSEPDRNMAPNPTTSFLGPGAAASASTRADGVPSDRRYHIDSNVIGIKFSVLSDTKELHTGDPVVCTNEKCTAILSSISAIKEEEGKSSKVWQCEFCQTKNEVDMVNEEIPMKEDTLYMLEPGKSVQVPNVNLMEGQTAATKDAIVVFCIDTSGSMGCTTEVSGKFKLKGHERMDALYRRHSEGFQQFLPRENRHVTYVSRLQGVQGAIQQQLQVLSNTSPSQKVALVTFNDEVTVCADGRNNEEVITGDKLGNYDTLERIGRGLSIPNSLRSTKQILSDKILSLEERGQTALGPAMLESILLAGNIPGSRVIICTDGLANIGIGRLDSEELTSPQKLALAEKFYTELGILARDKSVTVSILTTKGSESRLLELARVADITGGMVNIVDPLRVQEDFANILANPLLATRVVSKIVLHSDICFHRTFVDTDDSMLTIPVGNAFETTELTYGFEIRDHAKPNMKDAVTSKFSSTVTIGGEEFIPFQLQIEYTGLDQSRYLRVITKSMPITKNRSRADRGIQGRLWATSNMKAVKIQSQFRRHAASHYHATKILEECDRIESSNVTPDDVRAELPSIRRRVMRQQVGIISEAIDNEALDGEEYSVVHGGEKEIRVRKPEYCMNTSDSAFLQVLERVREEDNSEENTSEENTKTTTNSQ